MGAGASAALRATLQNSNADEVRRLLHALPLERQLRIGFSLQDLEQGGVLKAFRRRFKGLDL